MREFAGADVIGTGPRWLIVLVEVTQLANGDAAYTYSFAPGRTCTVVTRGGPGMLGPHDTAFAGLVAGIAGSYPTSAS